jgi:hypothetical protein
MPTQRFPLSWSEEDIGDARVVKDRGPGREKTRNSTIASVTQVSGRADT